MLSNRVVTGSLGHTGVGSTYLIFRGAFLGPCIPFLGVYSLLLNTLLNLIILKFKIVPKNEIPVCPQCEMCVFDAKMYTCIQIEVDTMSNSIQICLLKLFQGISKGGKINRTITGVFFIKWKTHFRGGLFSKFRHFSLKIVV